MNDWDLLVEYHKTILKGMIFFLLIIGIYSALLEHAMIKANTLFWKIDSREHFVNKVPREGQKLFNVKF